MARNVWFQLVNEATRDAYANTTVDSLRLPESAEDIADLRVAVIQKCPNSLTNVIAANLRVYADEAAYKAKKQCSPQSSLNELDAQATLIVEVPTQRLQQLQRPLLEIPQVDWT
ncbi:hypothetical protein F444_23012, partial [Phytophthora nicotianae P1976]